MSAGQIVETLKANGEDFEWYPTTQEIVDRLAEKIFSKQEGGEGEYECDYGSVLDIGCGNGSFFEKIDRTDQQKFNATGDHRKLLRTRYGIEKSFALCGNLPNDVVIIGSDFNEQTLIDKKVDLIFCNPPYSEFEAWAEKIIMQGNCKAIALVIPCRWKLCQGISYALKKREMEAEILGTFDFLNAERRARAKVDLLFITAAEDEYKGRRYRKDAKDPFDVWFDETFKISAEKEKVYDSQREEQKRQELVAKGDTAEMLVQFYDKDMQKLYANYRQLERLDEAVAVIKGYLAEKEESHRNAVAKEREAQRKWHQEHRQKKAASRASPKPGVEKSCPPLEESKPCDWRVSMLGSKGWLVVRCGTQEEMEAWARMLRENGFTAEAAQNAYRAEVKL